MKEPRTDLIVHSISKQSTFWAFGQLRLVVLRHQHAPESPAALVQTLSGGPSPKVLDSVGLDGA